MPFVLITLKSLPVQVIRKLHVNVSRQFSTGTASAVFKAALFPIPITSQLPHQMLLFPAEVVYILYSNKIVSPALPLSQLVNCTLGNSDFKVSELFNHRLRCT